MQEAGATADIELAYTCWARIHQNRLSTGMKIDEFAPRAFLFWAIGMNHFMELPRCVEE
jgi:methylmalonyl-CoA mutase